MYESIIIDKVWQTLNNHFVSNHIFINWCRTFNISSLIFYPLFHSEPPVNNRPHHLYYVWWTRSRLFQLLTTITYSGVHLDNERGVNVEFGFEISKTNQLTGRLLLKTLPTTMDNSVHMSKLIMASTDVPLFLLTKRPGRNTASQSWNMAH